MVGTRSWLVPTSHISSDFPVGAEILLAQTRMESKYQAEEKWHKWLLHSVCLQAAATWLPSQETGGGETVSEDAEKLGFQQAA